MFFDAIVEYQLLGFDFPFFPCPTWILDSQGVSLVN